MRPLPYRGSMRCVHCGGHGACWECFESARTRLHRRGVVEGCRFAVAVLFGAIAVGFGGVVVTWTVAALRARGWHQ